jgi:CheY-like chemotaxis protein
MFRDALEAAGARVRAVTSAFDAISACREQVPDLLVTDLGLPGMDGFDLLETIRSAWPELPAIAVTAYARMEDRARTRAAGFLAHLSKPIDPDALVREIAALVSRAN